MEGPQQQTPPTAPTPLPPDPDTTPLKERFGFGVAAGAVAAVIAGALYYFAAVKILRDQAVPILMIGPIIGGAMRAAGKCSDRRLGYVALLLSIVAIMIAFVIADTTFFIPFDLVLTLRRQFSVQGVLLGGLSAYLAMLMAVHRQS